MANGSATHVLTLNFDENGDIVSGVSRDSGKDISFDKDHFVLDYATGQDIEELKNVDIVSMKLYAVYTVRVRSNGQEYIVRIPKSWRCTSPRPLQLLGLE